MPKPTQQMENVQEKPKSFEHFYDPQLEQEGHLYKDSIMETYIHDMELSPIYKRKAEERKEIPPENGSFSMFKRAFKSIGRFLTGTPNYYNLYKKIDERWGAFNLNEESKKLKDASNPILERHRTVDPITKKEKIPEDDIFAAFTEMSKNGQFFDSEEGQDVLMDLDPVAVENWYDLAKAENKDVSQKKVFSDAVDGYKHFVKFQNQLKHFKDGNGNLTAESITALQDDFFFNNECSQYLFQLVTKAKASKESFEYAKENHPAIIQMIFYSQLLNQMDIAINQILRLNDKRLFPQDKTLPDEFNTAFLNLKQYAHLQAQKKEANRLLSELITKTDIKEDFKGKFESVDSSTVTESKNKDSKLKNKEEEKAEEYKSEKTEEKQELSLNNNFLKLYKEFTELSEDKIQDFLLKNLKNILDLAAKIAENQGTEEKDANGVPTSKSKVMEYVNKLSKDPFALDIFSNPQNISGLEYLMNVIAYMIPGPSVSLEKDVTDLEREKDVADLADTLSFYYLNDYLTMQKESIDGAKRLFNNYDLQHNQNIEYEFIRQSAEPMQSLTELNQGFHHKELEKFKELYSIFNKIICDKEAFNALSLKDFEKDQFQKVFYLITLDHSLYLLESKKQSDKEYNEILVKAKEILVKATQNLEFSLPLLPIWYENYTAEVSKKEKEKTTKALSDQIESLEKTSLEENTLKENKEIKNNENIENDHKKKKNKKNTEEENKEIINKDAQKLVDLLKEFSRKNPINPEDKNAPIYNSILTILTNPYATTFIKRPETKNQFLNLSKALLMKDQANDDKKTKVLNTAYKAYPIMAKAVQAETERVKAQDNETMETMRETHILLNQISDIRKKYLNKTNKKAISETDAKKLFYSLSKYIEQNPALEKDSIANSYKKIKSFLENPTMFEIMKDQKTLKTFLNLADSIMKTDKEENDKDKIANTCATIESALIFNALSKDIFKRKHKNLDVEEAEESKAIKKAIKTKKETLTIKLDRSLSLNIIEKKQTGLIQEKKNETQNLKKQLNDSNQNDPNLIIEEAPINVINKNLEENNQINIIDKQKTESNNNIQQNQVEEYDDSDELTEEKLENYISKTKSAGVYEIDNDLGKKVIADLNDFISEKQQKTSNAPMHHQQTTDIKEVVQQPVDIKATKDLTDNTKNKKSIEIQTKKTDFVTTTSSVLSTNTARKNNTPTKKPLNTTNISTNNSHEEDRKVENTINIINEKDAKEDDNVQLRKLEEENDQNTPTTKKTQTVFDFFVGYGQNKDKDVDKDVDKDLELLEQEINPTKTSTIKEGNKITTSNNINESDEITTTNNINESDEIKANDIRENLKRRLNQELTENTGQSEVLKEAETQGQNNQVIKLTEKNIPRSWRECSRKEYVTTPEMVEEFYHFQESLTGGRSKDKQIKKNADDQPEYYANYDQLYKAFTKNPTNHLFVKFLNLLKCNNLAVLQKAVQVYSNDPNMDSLLISHLEARLGLLRDLYKIKLGNKPEIKGNKFDLKDKEYQKEGEKPNICWSIALSNLLACQGISISSQLIRAARVENEPLNLAHGYEHSDAYIQSQRGAFNSVEHGFKQIEHLQVVKDYECIENSYGVSFLTKNSLDWNTWFVEQLKASFGGEKIDRQNASAMSFTEGTHFITILGFKNLNETNKDNITLYVHDSNPKAEGRLPEKCTLKELKEHLFKKHEVYKKAQKNPNYNIVAEKQKVLYDTGITYLKKKAKSKP